MNTRHRKETGSRGASITLLKRSNRISNHVSLALWKSSLLHHVFSRLMTQFCLIWYYSLTRGPTQWFDLTAGWESQGWLHSLDSLDCPTWPCPAANFATRTVIPALSRFAYISSLLAVHPSTSCFWVLILRTEPPGELNFRRSPNSKFGMFSIFE